MYLISIYFDEKTDKEIRYLMGQIAKNTGNTTLLDDNVPPHITISAFETKDEDNAKKIKKIYSQKGYNIYIKEVKLNNEEFYNNVTQFDLLLNNTNNSNEILKITEVVLANYEETVKSQ